MDNSINIEDIVQLVNTKLSDGASISSIERELKLGKDTLRKKLNRSGYKFSKEQKKFLFEGISENKNTSSNNKSQINVSNHKLSMFEHKSNPNVTQTLNEPKCNSNVTQVNEQLKSKEIENKEENKNTQILTEHQFKTLTKMIEEYELKEKEKTIEYKKDKDDVISRSFRSYRNVLDDFAAFCKKKDLTQREAVADAFILFMKLNS